MEEAGRLGGRVGVVFRGQGDADDEGDQVGDGGVRCHRAVPYGPLQERVRRFFQRCRAGVAAYRVGAGGVVGQGGGQAAGGDAVGDDVVEPPQEGFAAVGFGGQVVGAPAEGFDPVAGADS